MLSLNISTRAQPFQTLFGLAASDLPSPGETTIRFLRAGALTSPTAARGAEQIPLRRGDRLQIDYLSRGCRRRYAWMNDR